MKVLVYGTGKFAEYAAYLIDIDTQNEISAFCIEDEFRDERSSINNLPIVNFHDIEFLYPPDEFEMFIAVGLNRERARIFKEAKEKGYKLMSYISSKATVWDNLVYGENVWISEDTGVQPFVTIGDNSILFGAKIGHHSRIGDHTLLSECSFGGNVSVGNYTMIGLRTAVKQNVTIGENNIIGMGCTIEHNTNDNEIYHSAESTIKRSIPAAKIEKVYLK